MANIGIPASSRKSWYPTDLPSLVIWLDPSDTSTLTLVSGTHVSQINDKSGRGNNFAQGTDANRPTSGTTLNGLNILTYTTSQVLTHAALTFGPSLTVLSVAQGNATTGFPHGILAIDSGGGTTRVIQHRWTSQTVPETIAFWTSGVFFADGSGSDSTAAHVLCSVIDDTNHFARNYLDGVQNGTVDTSAHALNTASVAQALGNASGTGAPWSGTIGEIIVCSTALSTTDIARASNYLRTRWGTP